ncbi:MAG: zinc-dependent peptidase [Bacteroidales bacterium]|nr:zinc-dependent peptidase [Bacteroidales bacterium]
MAFISREEKWKLNKFYGARFSYYNKLSDKDKERFIVRAHILMHKIRIEGRQGFKIDLNEKLFVLAAYIQLTFGFKKYFLPKFKRIFVYPDAYRNQSTGNMHYGEVNPRGVIVLSWKRLLKGNEIIDDGINLGLHEMAHALMHTIIHSNDHELGLDPFLRDIVRLSKHEMEKIKSEEHHLFRRYAGSNIYEFFAVAIENFFELPVELQKELPTLYTYLVRLLKQDPLK